MEKRALHVTYKESKRIVEAWAETLRQDIAKTWNLEEGAFVLQQYIPDFNDVVDVLEGETIAETTKQLKVVMFFKCLNAFDIPKTNALNRWSKTCLGARRPWFKARDYRHFDK